MLYQLLFAAILTSLVFCDNPLEDPKICGSPKCDTQGTGKFKYGPGTQQNYKYSVEVRSTFNGTNKNESTLFVEGMVGLTFLTPCDGLLDLSDIKLSENRPGDSSETGPEHANSELFGGAISEFTLRFAFKDGSITELCPQPEEKSWVLNFKRGVLSMLQNTMKRFDLDHSAIEEDVHGRCPTDYKVIGALETSLVIEKTKDLSYCDDGSKLHSIIQSTPVPNFQSNAKKDHILKSFSRCTLSVDDKIYNDITCEETHVLQPFSNYSASASTVVLQKLSLRSEEEIGAKTIDEEIPRRACLLFDHVPSPKPTSGELKTSRDLIKQLCRANKHEDKIGLSDLFSKFIHSLRLLSYPGISVLYKHAAGTCPSGKKHLLDALPFVSTAASVALIKDIILKEAMLESTVNEWMISMAFIAWPDEEMMESALALVRKKNFSDATNTNIALGVASLTHTFCSQHSNCQGYESVGAIVEYLENFLLDIYKQGNINRSSHDNIMSTLKALSTIGFVTDYFKEQLFEIIKNPEMDTAIRLAAVETFRRLPCEENRSYFERMFRNQDVNSEVRIASYLQIMRCPNYLLIRTIRHSLLNEEVNQVGSFVWTHLNNLLKTSVPSKVEIQSLLSEKDLVRKFSSDIRKFSRNFEGSLYFDEYNFGGSYESNVIFSTSSYVPKSAMVNLTVDLFGESVNVLEVNGRAEGFEQYLESLFGPRGSSRAMANQVMEKLRITRDVGENELIKSQVDQLPNILAGAPKEPKVSLGMKIFGNELKYATFNGGKELGDATKNLDPIYHLKKILSGKEINYNKAAMFLDGNYVVPSGAGLPISLNAVGTASINIKLYGSLQAAGFSKGKELELDLAADLEPTVSLDITGEMAVDAFYSSTGIKLKTNMYTGSSIKGSVKIRGTKLVSVKFSLPKRNNEIFSASSELLVKQNNVEELQEGLSSYKVSKSVCSWPEVDKTMGLKVCAEYNFINVTKAEDMPFFLLAGPAGFRWYLSKSDPTASLYLFEYKWTHRKDLSVVSLTFDTPGSAVKRLFNANLTIDRQSQNLTMLLHSSAGTVLARGKYKNTVDEKFLQVALDINEKKHFDANVALSRVRIKNGFSYRPKLYLGVNGERVVNLEGTVEYVSKKSISQSTVDLKFETKRLHSKLFGYISKSENSMEANLYHDYKFQHIKEQRVALKFGVANRSRKNMFVIVGFANLNSTAYPNMNFASNATFQRSGGHMDLTVKLLQNPLWANHPEADYHTLYCDLFLSYKSLSDTKRLTAVAGISRKSSNLALKGEFVYESFRHEVTAAAQVRYGNNKEVAVTVFWSHPRSTLEQIKTHINVTIPSFTPMILKVEIEEKQPKDYVIDVKGTWFSGHSVAIVGFYQDRSASKSSNQHVKLFLKSPNFKDINIDLQFYRDNDALKLDLKGFHDSNDYQLLFNHQSVSVVESKTEAWIKYKTKLYRFISSVYDKDFKKVHAELHIDQIRDVDFSAYVYNQENQKALGFEINWDANRDPNQKLLVSTNYTKIADFNYVANFIIGYPTRSIIGEYKFLLEKGHIDTLASVSWDDGKTFAIDLNMLYEFENKIYLVFISKVNTPFDNWKITKFDGSFEHLKNKYDFKGLVFWDKNHKVAIDVFGDYTSLSSFLNCKYSCSITSSIDRIPNINTTFSHMQNETEFDTTVHLMYNPDFIIDIDSHWTIKSDKDSVNLTGTVISQSPFKGMNKGIMVSKILLKDRNYLNGIAHIDLDNRKMAMNMEGSFLKITNCRLIVNASTTNEDYQMRFIISTENRHFVALLTYPAGNFGGEVLLKFHNLNDFDIKLFLATPVEFLQKVLILTQLQPKSANFRLGWNSLLLGFSGVYHYANVTDFEYSYKIYTPIEDFEENGIVGKLILREGLDFEVSAKLSMYKLGAKLLGQSKPKPLKEMGIKIKDVYLRSKLSQEKEKDADDPLNWEGLIELDALIYPTMKGELEVDQKGESYFLNSKLTLPQGMAVIADEFEFIDIFTIRNNLQISTPLESFQIIESNFNLNIQRGSKYLFGFNFDFGNRSKLVQTGIYALYLSDRRKNERTYNVTVKVNTPFKAFPKLNLFGAFETEENFYHTTLLFNTNRSDISVDATTEMDKGLLEVISVFHVNTPSITIPFCQLRLTKLLTPDNNYVELNLSVPDRLQKEIYCKTSWLIKSKNEFRSMVLLETPFAGMENTTLGTEVFISEEKTTFWGLVLISPLEAEVNSTLLGDVLTSKSLMKFNGKSFPVSVKCKIQKSSQTRREFDGDLKLKDKLFKITGDADVIGNLPSRVSVKFTPEDGTPPVTFEYQLRPTAFDKYELEGSIRHSDRFTALNAHLMTVDKYNWELNLEMDTSAKQKFLADIKARSEANTKHLVIDAKTPIPKLENPKLGATYTALGLEHSVYGYFELTNAKGNVNLNIIWKVLENMLVRAIGHFENTQYSSESSLVAFYVNPEKSFRFFQAGGDVKIDKIWEAGSNLTFKIPLNSSIGIEGHFKVPDDNMETHSLLGNLNYTADVRNVEYLLKYRTDYASRKYGSRGKILTEDKNDLSGDVELEWNGKRYRNYGQLRRTNSGGALDLIYKLKTPQFTDKQLIVTEMKYKSSRDRHNLTCEAFYPENRTVAYATVDYKELANMHGMFNITVPYRSLNYTGAYFDAATNAIAYNRYIKVFWDGDNAILDSKCDIKTGATLSERNTKGRLIAELPLATRHVALVDYEYDKKGQVSVGRATVNYNGTYVLEGKYNCLSESYAGFDKDTIDVEVQNNMVPVGAKYVHQHEYGGGDAPTADNKYLHLFHLQNRSKFNVTGELNIQTTWSGQKYVLTAIHSNRTVKLWTDYDILEKEYKQRTRLELSPTNWIEYDLNLVNRTVDQIFDAQHALIKIFYPRRSFTANCNYNISNSIVLTDMSLMWGKENKTVQAGLDWRRASLHREQLSVQIKHPSFEKDVTFFSDYGFTNLTADGKLVVDYSSNEDQKLTLSGIVEDKSNASTYSYVYSIKAEHNATNLNLNAEGNFHWNPRGLGTDHLTNYKRSYLPMTVAETLARLDLDTNEIEIKKESVASGLTHFWGRYGGKFPIYTANMTSKHGSNDTSGNFYVDLKQKIVVLDVNLTADSTQSLHMYGFIPDARSAVFDIWRDYEDKRVSDVSYYLRLNHSRLIMSSLRWRPDLIADVQGRARGGITQFYLDILEGINNTRQYMRAETLEAIHGVWLDAKPGVQHFLDDLRNLTVIEEDIKHLKVFLNESYNANEFYIKDITNVVVIMFDEMALKTHLQSLPKIFQEIWSMMGQSGQKISKSILWVIDKIKTYYENTTKFIHGLINGDPIEHITKGLEKLVETYDNFIKNLHVTVLQYMESLWQQTYSLIVENWHRTLAAIEPTFLKFLHYLESIVWNTGKDFLDFLYLRKNEIIESPYFVRFSKFSQDIDKFYKEITGKHTIASIYKYLNIAWNFLKQKYLNLIPFGKELISVVNEIITELKQIEDIPSIRFIINKFNEYYNSAKYYYDYFDMDTKIHKLVNLIYVKWTDMSITALEAENRERDPKTKFIFEPNDGIMLMETKLPMSWHAFNETPKFKEIPEIKAMYDLGSYLEMSHVSFWNLYYDYKPFTDPADWLPPFRGHAMLAGSRYYVTFDKTFYDFQGGCTYLLAADFQDRNFTLLVSEDPVADTHELILLLNKTVVHINISNGRVRIGDSGTERLPAQVAGVYLHRQSDILTVESDLGFVLECNIKFHICIFEMSGWYFGKTAGLWGTYNNEALDDFSTGSGDTDRGRSLGTFADIWALDKNCKSGVTGKDTAKNVPEEVASMCDEFFNGKISQLSTCFPRVPKDSFLAMCLNSRDEREVCMSAVSYINLCSYANTPLRIPDTCVKCNLLNGTELREGDFIRLQGRSVPQTADVVFIVEAKKCNSDLKNSKNMETVVELLEKELKELNITDNRYAAVVFGGDNVYDDPRSIILDGRTFVDAGTVIKLFDELPLGNGTSDIFGAISFAYNLIFRPGVSKNFILMPCSPCNKYNMLHDYSTIHQLLSESAISLHILMNEHFNIQRERDSKIPFGIDRRYAYTKKDLRGIVGDQPLRKSIILPKSSLGICLSLALETNGTIFSAKQLETDRKNAKKFSTVFAKAVARSAAPSQCVDCECTAHNSGISYMECYQCTMTNLTRPIEHHMFGLDEDDNFAMNVLDSLNF